MEEAAGSLPRSSTQLKLNQTMGSQSNSILKIGIFALLGLLLPSIRAFAGPGAWQDLRIQLDSNGDCKDVIVQGTEFDGAVLNLVKSLKPHGSVKMCVSSTTKISQQQVAGLVNEQSRIKKIAITVTDDDVNCDLLVAFSSAHSLKELIVSIPSANAQALVVLSKMRVAKPSGIFLLLYVMDAKSLSVDSIRRLDDCNVFDRITVITQQGAVPGTIDSKFQKTLQRVTFSVSEGIEEGARNAK